MKKILIGVCGIGNGHINRQKLVIEHLLQYDVDIVLAVTENSYKYFNNIYPDLKKVLIYVPWIFCNNQGIDFENTRKKYIHDGVDQFDKFLSSSIEIQNAFDGEKPDLVMTDYEPNVAQFAYAVNSPLICLDQHSKFLNLNAEIINDFSINIETSRLLYFFPKANKRYVSSFFEINDCHAFNIEVLPPIIKDIERISIKKNKVVVYFSSYTNDSKIYTKVLELIKDYADYEFYVYTDIDFCDYRCFNNIKFKKIGSEFDLDLTDCYFIISTAGHQLISEAIYLEIPLLIFPLDTFDQNYCCYMVQKLKFGKQLYNFNKSEWDDFIENLDSYKFNMKEYREHHWGKKWNEVLFGKLEKEFGIKKRIEIHN